MPSSKGYVRDYKREYQTARARGEVGTGHNSGSAERHRLRRKADRQLGLSLPLRAVRGVGYMMLTVDERSHRR